MENQPPSISPRKSFPKWLVVIVIVFLLATTAFFAYQNFKLKQQVTQTPTSTMPTPLVSPEPSAKAETANWKTYTSTRAGFSLKYPSNWALDENTTDYAKLRIALFPLGQTYDGSTIGNEIFNIEWGEGDTRTLAYIKSEYYPQAIEIIIGGKQALKVYEDIFAIIKVSDNVSVEVRGGQSINQKSEATKYFDQILSTFQFTD